MASFSFPCNFAPCRFKGLECNRHLVANDRVKICRVEELARVDVRLDEPHREFKELFSIHSNHLLVFPDHLGMSGSGARVTVRRNRNQSTLIDFVATYRNRVCSS